MNRNVVKLGLVGVLTSAILLLGFPTGAQAATIGNTNAKGGVWITATAWPSRYGDLSSIAGSVYGNRGLWYKIYQANRKTISDPNFIRVGQRIYVPQLGNAHNNAAPPPPRRTSTAAKWRHPLPGVRVSSCYGWRWGAMHQGIDYDGNYGNTIRAVGAGTVKRVGWWAGGYGISVLVYHGNNVYSHYAHMQRAKVRVGQKVLPGQKLGEVGSTGDATGSHLHFEIWRGMWNQIDPRGWLRAHGLRPGC